MSTTSKIVLVTGATAGIGRMTALHLAKQGHHVLATGRKLGELAKLKAEAQSLRTDRDAPVRLDTLALDVTSAASIATAVGEVDAITNGYGLDVLVNNAGFGVLGPTSEITDEEMRRQYDTNVFGLMSVTRAFLPKMQARRAGRIINVSSVGGRITLPFFGVYNSTKYAVESLSDALRYELGAWNIDVTLIEPGVIRTNFEATATGEVQRFANTAYGPAIAKTEELSRRADKFASEPIVVAKAIARAVRARRSPARMVAPRSNNLLIWMSAIVPTRMWDWSMRKIGYLTRRDLRVDIAPPAAPATAKPTTAVHAAN